MDLVKRSLRMLGKKLRSIWRSFSRVGREDPKRILHSAKVGLALTLTTLLYLVQPFSQYIGGKNVMWSIMTIVVVFENNAGATLFKGFNRLLGTVAAAMCAFAVQYVAGTYGTVFHIIFIAGAVFLNGAISSYVRYFPYIKKNYDYAVSIWLLTFCLVNVTSHGVENVIKIDRERCVAIAIGCGMCLFMTLLLPIWSGEELHTSIATKLEKLSRLVQACVYNYFKDEEESEGSSCPNPSASDYLEFVDSKSKEDTLALHSSWEPRFLRHFRSSWGEYAKLGSIIRQFGIVVVNLRGLSQTKTQAPKSVRDVFKDPCIRLASEVSKALLELSTGIRHRQLWTDQILSADLRVAQQDLKIILKSLPRLLVDNPEAVYVSTFVCLLEMVVERLEETIEQATTLARIACFKDCWYDVSEVVVTVEETEVEEIETTSNQNP